VRPRRRGPANLALAAALAALFSGGSAAAGLRAEQDRFFSSDEPARLILETDLSAIEAGRLARDDPPFRPGTLRHLGPGEDTVTRTVEVRRRGNSRRYLCDFPPLLVRFPDGPPGGPVFGDHQALYHVGHCQNRDPGFDAYALKEYLAYRLWAEVAEIALRARPARITYLDTGGDVRAGTRWAFLVEDRSRLARRAGGSFVDDPASVEAGRVPVREATLLAVFQYMIGNTDWSIETMHNVMFLETGDGTLHPVPFDFDFSGLVNAPYARPRQDLGLASVRERAFVGACRTGADHPGALARLREARPRLLTTVDRVPGLEADQRAEARGYLESFFRLAEDPGAVRREIVEACR